MATVAEQLGCTIPGVAQEILASIIMPVSLQISAALPEDHEWCARLMASSEPWITLRQDIEICRRKLMRAGMELFVARHPSELRPLGFILLAPYGMAGSPYISSIEVVSEARGQGVGAQLLRFAEQHYTGRGHIFLLVSSFNPRAQKFYRREGFEFVGELKDYIVPGHSELVFHKRLS